MRKALAPIVQSVSYKLFEMILKSWYAVTKVLENLNTRDKVTLYLYMIKWIKFYQEFLKKIFINKTRQHLHNTRRNSLDVPQVKTTTYGTNSFTLHAIRAWNFFQNKLSTTSSLPNLTLTKFLKVIKTYISEKAKIPQNKL